LRERARAGGAGGGEAGSLLSKDAGSGSIPGPRDHDLRRRQMLNQLSHPGVPLLCNS